MALQSTSPLTEALSSAGYQIRLVTEPKGTILAAKESRADLAVVDLRQSREESLWWVVEMLESDPVTAKVPLVALAESAALEPERRRYLAERDVHVLPHLFAPRDLLSLVGERLSERH